MNLRRAVVLGAVTAALVSIGTAVAGASDVALAALGVAVLGMLGYLVLAVRSLADAVATATGAADRARRGGQSAGRDKGRGPRQQAPRAPKDADVPRRLQGIERRLGGLARGQGELRNTLHRLPGLTAEMARAYDDLVPHSHPMPEFGGWAATPSTMLWIIDRVLSSPVRTVVECGSGSSTVWVATALERRGGDGRIVALESSDHYAAQTRAELERLGLGDRATVVHAPLVATDLPDRPPQPWFDVSGLELGEPIDLLFVDGPPGNVAPESRYPAFPVLAHLLAPDAVVVLDDTGRPAEDAIVERWTSEVHADRTLAVSKTVDRSTVLVATGA